MFVQVYCQRYTDEAKTCEFTEGSFFIQQIFDGLQTEFPLPQLERNFLRRCIPQATFKSPLQLPLCQGGNCPDGVVVIILDQLQEGQAFKSFSGQIFFQTLFQLIL